MTDKHTPGPWGLWSEEGHDKHGHPLISVCRNSQGPLPSGWLSVQPDGEHVCIAEARGKDDETALANARLIAAAPDLLAACKEAIRLHNYTGDDATDFAACVDGLLAAAIAKAEGR